MDTHVLARWLLLIVFVSCALGARVLLQSLHSRTKQLLGWVVGFFYGAWSISFLISTWDHSQGAEDWWIALSLLVLFPYALLLSFPPGFLKPWKNYLLAVASFVAAEIFLVLAAVKMLADPNFDDSAGAMFVIPMMLLPTVLLVCLLALRWFASTFKRIWKELY